MSSMFLPHSIELTQTLTKEVKKKHGIFFTPSSLIEQLKKPIEATLITTPTSILEPSFGSGEIIHQVHQWYPQATIDGVENHPMLYETTSSYFNSIDRIHLHHHNFITWSTPTTYDLIIGNPPYVVCSKQDVPLTYQPYITGRANIFGIFILHTLSMLKIGGVMAIIIPKSFLNASYYDKIRYELQQCGTVVSILDFEALGGFMDTQQPTVGFVFQKTGRPGDGLSKHTHTLSIFPTLKTIFAVEAENLRSLWEGATTLQAMGFQVTTGTIVWNQHKTKVTDDANQTVLIYNSNVTTNGTLVWKTFSNEEKKQYIKHTGVTDRVLVVNRGNGNSAYRLGYALVDINRPYLVENHLNVIKPRVSMDPERCLQLYHTIIRSFNHPKTQQFIRLFLGTNGLSKSELETIFPIYIDLDRV